MNQGRGAHAIGIITDEVTQEKLIIVTGGYGYDMNIKNYNTDISNTTEVLLDGVWVIGKMIYFPGLKKQDL